MKAISELFLGEEPKIVGCDQENKYHLLSAPLLELIMIDCSSPITKRRIKIHWILKNTLNQPTFIYNKYNKEIGKILNRTKFREASENLTFPEGS